MRKSLAVPLATLILFTPALASENSPLPEIEVHWTLIRTAPWLLYHPEQGGFIVGTQSFYRHPQQNEPFGLTLTFLGSNKPVLRAWWYGSEKVEQATIVVFAVKTENQEWLYGEGRDTVSLIPKIKKGKLVAIELSLTETVAGVPAGTVVRTIFFEPPLKRNR